MMRLKNLTLSLLQSKLIEKRPRFHERKECMLSQKLVKAKLIAFKSLATDAPPKKAIARRSMLLIKQNKGTWTKSRRTKIAAIRR